MLADVGRITAAGQVELLEVSTAPGRQPQLIPRVRWEAQAGNGPAAGSWGIREEVFLRWAPALRQGEIVHEPLGGDGAAKGSGAQAGQTHCGGGSVAALPVQADGHWWGILAIRAGDPARDWATAELAGLRAIAAAAGALLHTGLVQDRLAETRARYQTLVEQVPAVIYIDLPQEGRTAYVSPQIEAVLGVAPDEWVPNDTWAKMLHPADREWVLAQYRDFVQNGGPHLAEYRMVRPDGRVVWIRDRAQASRDDSGRVITEQGLMIDVTELKEAEATAQRHAALLERVDSVSRQLTELMLQGGSPARILQFLARVVENPVLLEDAAHQLIDFATHSAPVGHVLGAWDAHSRVGHPGHPNGVTVQDGSDHRCAWIPLSIRGEEWGRLHVLELDTALGDADKFPLDRAAAAISLALLGQRDAAYLSDQARSTLLDRIARGVLSADGEIFRRARGLGAELEEKTLAGMVIELREAASPAPAELSERDRQRVRARVLEESRRALAEAGCSSLSGLEGDRVLALLGLPPDREARAVLEEAGDAVCRRAGPLGEQVTLSVGFSRPNGRPAFARLLEEAAEAAAFGAASPGRPQVRHFGELGVHHLLAHLAEGPELSSFVESELSPLLGHDATARVPLLPTLAAYLEHGGRVAAAARALHLERRTLYVRIGRIEKLLGRSLSDHEVQLHCQLAIRGLELLRLRSPSAGTRGDLPRRRRV